MKSYAPPPIKFSVLQENSASVNLPSTTTYNVYAIAPIDGTDIKLTSMYMVLNEDRPRNNT